MRSSTYDSGPTRLVSASSSPRHGGGRLLLAPGEVEVLDLGRLVDVAVLLADRVVEVLVAGAHAADVQRDARAGEVEDPVGARRRRSSSPIATMPPAEICSGPSVGSRSASPALRSSPHTCWNFSGSKKIGSQPSACWAVSVDALAHQAGPEDRDVGPLRVVDQLQRLAEPGALALGQRDLHASGRRRRPARAATPCGTRRCSRGCAASGSRTARRGSPR